MTIPVGYSWFPGFNAADGSLVLISDDLAPYTVPALGSLPYTAKSGLIDTFPIRSMTLDGQNRGDGMIMAKLTFTVMPVTAFQYILATYFSSGTVVSVPMTLGLAQYGISTIWQKWNAWMTLPQPFVTYSYDSQNMLGVTISLSDLILLS